MIKSGFIQKLRKRNNLSQVLLAEKIGVSRPTYMQIEKGERELTISEAERLARVYGIDLSDLLANREEARRVTIVKRKKSAKKSDDDMEMRIQEKDLEKFKQVFLYIISKVGARPNVGETVLYKLLYFIDFDYYEKYERNIMGVTYIKNHFGPTPVEFKTVVDEMEKNGELERVTTKHFQFEQKKYLPLIVPDINILSAQEIKHIDEVLARLGSKSAKELSEYSHTDTPWMIHGDGEKIQYESVFYRDDDHSVRQYDDDL